MSPPRTLKVAIDRPAAETYRVLSASAGDWIAAGAARVELTEPNDRGVLDYSLTLPGGLTTYVPLRVVCNGSGCELVLTLFAHANLCADDALRSLRAAKRVLEAASAGRPESRDRVRERS